MTSEGLPSKERSRGLVPSSAFSKPRIRAASLVSLLHHPSKPELELRGPVQS